MPDLLANPFAKPSPISKPLYSPLPKPSTTSAGGVSVTTSKPIFVARPLSQPQNTIVIEKNQEAPKGIQSPGFWASKTNKQKIVFVGVGIVAVILIVSFSKKK